MSININRWTVTGNYSQSDGLLKATANAGTDVPNIVNNMPNFSGDFDINVDFDVQQFGTNLGGSGDQYSGVFFRINMLGGQWHEVELSMSRVEAVQGPAWRYITNGPASKTTHSAGSNAGTLRIARTSGTITLYKDGATSMATVSDSDTVTDITIFTASVQADNSTTIHYDNFLLSVGGSEYCTFEPIIDQSVNKSSISQYNTSVATADQNSLDTSSYNGTSSYVDTGISVNPPSGFTLILVAKFDAINGAHHYSLVASDPLGGGSNPKFIFGNWVGDNKIRMHSNPVATNNNVLANTDISTSAYAVYSVKYDNVSGYIYHFLNGVADGSGPIDMPATISSTITLGWSEGNLYFDGKIGEYKFYNSAKSDADILSITNELKTKWNI